MRFEKPAYGLSRSRLVSIVSTDTCSPPPLQRYHRPQTWARPLQKGWTWCSYEIAWRRFGTWVAVHPKHAY